MLHQFTCAQCGLNKTHETPEIGGATGYGYDKYNAKICYDCCGLNDAQQLRELMPGKKAYMYWDGTNITNWPGTLKIKPYLETYHRHNFSGHVTVLYFNYEGKDYQAKQYGENTNVAHIRKLKAFK